MSTFSAHVKYDSSASNLCAQFVIIIKHYWCSLGRGQGVKPLGQQPGGKESERPRSLAHDPRKMNAEVIHQLPPLFSRPPALSRRALSGLARRIPPRGPKERPAPRRPRPARVRGPRAVDTCGVDRWRAANHTARTAAPTSRRWGRRHLRRRCAARAGGAVLVLPQGPAGQRSARLHSLHAAARVKALRAACGPLQRRTARARVDLLRLGAPGLRPPP